MNVIFDPITQILQNGGEFNLNAVVAAAVGIGQILMFWYGIHRMNQNNKERMVSSREEAERRDKQDERRHNEVMTSLAQEREQSQALIRSLDQGREQNQVTVRALETLIERTAPTREDTPRVILAVR